jgi:protein ImuB
MLWACLRFPGLAFSAAFAALPEHMPGALLENNARRRAVAMANPAAQKLGVQRGQSVAAARALCPGLVVRSRDKAAEARLLEELAAWCYQFSGHVSLAPPRCLLLEAGASLRLFDGWTSFSGKLKNGLAALGHPHTLAAAPYPAASWVLAACADGCVVQHPEQLRRLLEDIPLNKSGLTGASSTALRAMGFRRLREVFALPRPELSRRIGRDGMHWLDRLRGHANDVMPAWQPPARFDQRLEFDMEVEGSEPLMFPLRRLTQALGNMLAARDGGVLRFRLRLEHARESFTDVMVGMAEPQRDASRLFELARTRIERTTLHAGVRALELQAEQLPTFSPPLRDLFDQVRGDGLDWSTLDERLRARLGDAALGQLSAMADHRPERASRRGEGKALAEPEPRPRPLWLLGRPRPMRPAPARVLAGPERIESGWWDGGDQRRDYYIVGTTHGQRAWAYLPAGSRDGWMLHGWFA